MSSNSHPRVSNDNAYAESLFKTIKYRPNYQPKGFYTLYAASLWVKGFVEWYDNEHPHSGINFMTPNQRHSTDDGEAILQERIEVYEEVKSRNPNRWSRKIRNWTLSTTVWLNPEKVVNEDDNTEAIEAIKVS